MSDRESADLLIEPRWLLPMTATHGALAGQAVAVGAGRILAVGPAAELRARFEARATLARPRHALLPGLVNAATYASRALLRGLPQERAVEAGADLVRDGTRLAMAEMLRAGITCFADLSEHPEEAARAAAAAQVRAAIGLPVSEHGSAWAENATAYFARAEQLWDEYRTDSRISLYFAPLAAHALTDATLGRIRRVADELDARIALDLCAAADAHGAGPAVAADAEFLARLAGLGLLRPGFTAIGLGARHAGAVEILARHGAAAVACPRTELRAGRLPYLAPLPGTRTGFGTGSPVRTGVPDLLAEARLAALAGALTAADALRMATLGGATALGLQAITGSIEPGKAADLACIDLGTLECRTAPGIEAAVLEAATRSQVSDVWTGGRCAVSEGRLLAFDEEEIAALPARWMQRLKLEAAA
ncbi:MAG: amidohydrolase family protein [Proteobacteria bacterium]|nr:amidohydrolase family protein [Pseudomonadota bacterium]